MRCKTCGGDRLVETRYRFGERSNAPALECERCHAIDLDELLATTKDELDSVRLAVAARWGSKAPPAESGSFRASPTLSAAEVEGVCSEVDLATAEIRLCLEFLVAVSTGESWKAVIDAHRSLYRIQTLVDDLAKRCERETRRSLAPAAGTERASRNR